MCEHAANQGQRSLQLQPHRMACSPSSAEPGVRVFGRTTLGPGCLVRAGAVLGAFTPNFILSFSLHPEPLALACSPSHQRIASKRSKKVGVCSFPAGSPPPGSDDPGQTTIGAFNVIGYHAVVGSQCPVRLHPRDAHAPSPTDGHGRGFMSVLRSTTEEAAWRESDLPGLVPYSTGSHGRLAPDKKPSCLLRQDLKYRGGPCHLVIGDRNDFRELVQARCLVRSHSGSLGRTPSFCLLPH